MNGFEAKHKEGLYDGVAMYVQEAYDKLDNQPIKVASDYDLMYKLNQILTDLTDERSSLREIWDAND